MKIDCIQTTKDYLDYFWFYLEFVSRIFYNYFDLKRRIDSWNEFQEDQLLNEKSIKANKLILLFLIFIFQNFFLGLEGGGEGGSWEHFLKKFPWSNLPYIFLFLFPSLIYPFYLFFNVIFNKDEDLFSCEYFAEENWFDRYYCPSS